MLIGSLVKATVELQGFRVMNVAGNADGLCGDAWPRPALCAAVWSVPRAGAVARHPSNPTLPARADMRDRGGATIRAVAGELFSVRRCACRVDAVGERQTTHDASPDGDAGDVDAGAGLGARGDAVALPLSGQPASTPNRAYIRVRNRIYYPHGRLPKSTWPESTPSSIRQDPSSTTTSEPSTTSCPRRICPRSIRTEWAWTTPGRALCSPP